MLLLAIWLIQTDKLVRGEKVYWWSFAGWMVLWTNIHGEYISGLLVLISYLGGWLWDYLFHREEADPTIGKQLGLAFVASLAVTLLNPISLRAWTTVTTWLGNDYLMEKTQETIPPNFLNSEFYILLAMIGFSIFILAVHRTKLHTGQAIMLAGFTIMVLTSARNVHIYGIIAPFVLAAPLVGIMSPSAIGKIEENIQLTENKLKGTLFPFIIIVAAIIMINTTNLGHSLRFSPSVFPTEAAEWSISHPQQGNMFNPFDWGGDLSFTILPDNKVFIDSQGDVYGEAFIREYEQVITLAPGWQNVLDKYHVSWAIVPRVWTLATALTGEGWSEIYRDDTSVIMRRNE